MRMTCQGFANDQDMSGVPPNMMSQYASMMAKANQNSQITPEMQAAMLRL